MHGDTLALEEGELPGWAFSLSQDDLFGILLDPFSFIVSISQDVAPPLSLSTTFTQEADGPIYSRIACPTRSRCETLLGNLEGTGHGSELDSVR